jgi:hypothetical protein
MYFGIKQRIFLCLFGIVGSAFVGPFDRVINGALSMNVDVSGNFPHEERGETLVRFAVNREKRLVDTIRKQIAHEP